MAALLQQQQRSPASSHHQQQQHSSSSWSGGTKMRGRGQPPGNNNSPSGLEVLLSEKSNPNSDPDPAPQQQPQPPAPEPQEGLELVDTGLLFADIMAVAIACQFMGLMDVLGDSDFWKNGGWFQPIQLLYTSTTTSSPSTLPVLVQRFSLNTILWVAASWCLGGYNADSSSSSSAPTTTTTTQQDTLLLSALQRSAVYSVLRTVMGVAMSLWLVSSSSSDNHHPTLASLEDMIQILRECYTVSLTAIAARYVVFVSFNR